MHSQSVAFVATCLVLSAAPVGCVAVYPRAPIERPASASRVAAAPPGTANTAPKDHEQRHVYRLDFVVSSNDPGKSVSSSSYTLNLDEEQSGEVRMGTNVPLSSQARMDVGLKLKASLTSIRDGLLLQSATEISSFEEPSTIRKITTNGVALLEPGRSALVASLEDPSSHKRFQVTATATKLR